MSTSQTDPDFTLGGLSIRVHGREFPGFSGIIQQCESLIERYPIIGKPSDPLIAVQIREMKSSS